MSGQWMTVTLAGILLAAMMPQATPAAPGELVGASGSTGRASPQLVRAAADRPALAPVTRRFDVDGDRRPDRVSVSQVRTDRYLLTVTTARGAIVRVPVASSFQRDWGQHPWIDQGGIDGVPGAEIVLAVSGGDGVSAVVLTWRGGKLANLAAPPSRGITSPSRRWYLLSDEARVAGYRFWTAGGQRKAAAGQFELQANGRWAGVLITSVWAANGWRTVETRAATVSPQVAQAYGGLHGVVPAR